MNEEKKSWIGRKWCLFKNFLKKNWVLLSIGVFLFFLTLWCYSKGEYYALLTMVLTSAVAAVIVLLLERFLRQSEMERAFGVLEGWYVGHGYNKTTKIEDKPQSKAWVEYERDNRLKITVESGYDKKSSKYEWKWKGKIIMNKDYEGIGEISWEYRGIPDNQPENMRILGFKRCIVNGKDEIILIGEEIEGYGKEFLHKKKTEKEIDNILSQTSDDDEKKKKDEEEELITKHQKHMPNDIDLERTLDNLQRIINLIKGK